MELRALLKTCWKRKWVILAFVIILPLATLITCLMMTKVYEASAKVKILQFEGVQALLQRQIPENWGELDHVSGIPTHSQAEVIRSRMVMEPVIKKLNLRRRVTIVDKLLKSIGLIKEYRDEYIRLDKLVEPGFIGAFLQRRQAYVDPIADSDIIEICAYSDIPEEARDMANEIALSYVEQAGGLKQQKAREALEIIENNLAASKGKLTEAQNNLRKFQETHYVVNLEGRINDIQANLNNLENQRLSVGNDLMVRESRLRELSEAPFDSEGLQATLKSAEGYPHIRDMQSRLIALEASLAATLTGKTPKHPDVMELQAEIDGMKKQILDEIRRLLENDIIELKKNKQLLGASIGDIKKELERLADTNRELADLQRQIDIAETTYLTLAAERDSALTAAGTNYSNATIITFAELPDRSDPYYPKPALYLILAVVLGLMFGFGMAFVVEFMDISVKSVDDIKRASDLRLLGVIPKMRSLRVSKVRKLDTPDKFAGAIMEISHNVLTYLEDKKIIAVASALTKEGKTKLISHLAVALADQGRRVALVDLNLKNPALHSVFDVSNVRGVSDILLREDEAATEIVQTNAAFPQLSIVAAGPGSEGLLHKLGSPALEDYIESLGENYDYVLLDSAALDCFAGGLAVAALAQRALLVVSIEGPSPKKLKEAVNALESAGVEITGVVANRV